MHGCIALATMCLALGGAIASAPPAAGSPPAALVAHPTLERMALREVNRVRARHGRARLRLRAAMRRPARAHATRVTRTGQVSHEGPGGSPFWVRLRAVGAPYPLGEVIASHFSCRRADLRRVMGAWMASASHRRTILGERYRTAAVSIVSRTRCGQGSYVLNLAG